MEAKRVGGSQGKAALGAFSLLLFAAGFAAAHLAVGESRTPPQDAKAQGTTSVSPIEEGIWAVKDGDARTTAILFRDDVAFYDDMEQVDQRFEAKIPGLLRRVDGHLEICYHLTTPHDPWTRGRHYMTDLELVLKRLLAFVDDFGTKDYKRIKRIRVEVGKSGVEAFTTERSNGVIQVRLIPPSERGKEPKNNAPRKKQQ